MRVSFVRDNKTSDENARIKSQACPSNARGFPKNKTRGGDRTADFKMGSRGNRGLISV